VSTVSLNTSITALLIVGHDALLIVAAGPAVTQNVLQKINISDLSMLQSFPK